MPLYTSGSATLVSAALTGSPTAPTPTAGDNDTSVATTAFVQTEIAAKGAHVSIATDVSSGNYTTAAAISWDTAIRNSPTCFSTSAPTRLTVPSSATAVRLQGQVTMTNITSGLFTNVAIQKNGSAAYPGYASASSELTNTFNHLNISTPVIAVTSTSYFELYLTVETDTSITLASTQSWFALEVIP